LTKSFQILEKKETQNLWLNSMCDRREKILNEDYILYIKCPDMRYMPATVAILMLLLIATSINSTHSSLQQEVSIQNMGDILYQESFAEGIFFEYGAESGILQPPWDVVGAVGDQPKTGSYTVVDDTHARTGTNSMKLYQIPPTKSDAQRRISNRYYETGRKEFYVSWWAYFDNRWLTQDPDGWGTTLGGWQIFFGPSGEDPGGKWRWWTGGRFHVTNSARDFIFGYGWGKHADASDFSADAESIEQTWDTGYDIDDYLNQWVHFQLYIKMATDNTGVVRAWFNNNLVAEKTSIKTDPSGYPEFDANNCIWATTEYPMLLVELYQGTDSFESWIWVDDVVAASQKVPESYRVVD
jgi:hypothetical protein